MCRAIENFLLCTCTPEEEPLTPPYWVLRRDNSYGRDPDEVIRFRNEIVGIFIDDLPEFDFTEPSEDAKKEAERQFKIKRFICDELNARNCFDFKYSPAFHDVLTVKLADMECSFRFSDDGTSLSSGFEQKGRWWICSEPDQFFNMAKGKMGTIAPDLQIRNEDPL